MLKDGAKFYDVIVVELDSGKDCKLNRRQLLLGKNTYGQDFDLYLQFLRRKYDMIAQKNANCEQAKLYREMLELADQN